MAVKYEILLLEPTSLITRSFLSAQHFGVFYLIFNKTDESVSQNLSEKVANERLFERGCLKYQGQKNDEFYFCFSLNR